MAKLKKNLVRVIGFTSTSGIIRATSYRFCAHYSRFTEENLKAKYIPKDLRTPNSEFMMVWENKSNELIRIERLEATEIISIREIIEKYERALDYLDIKDEQEIDNEYLSVTKDFFNKILEVNYGYGVISDKSHLDYYAIAFGESLESYQEKIKLYYDVDILDIINTPMLEIVKQIDSKK